LKRLEVRHGRETRSLFRPVYPFEPDAPILNQDTFVGVRIDEGGLKASGFIAGFGSAIFPAEYRGITVPVRAVPIGDPRFFVADHLLGGVERASLSQITGDINVLAGLAAVDTLNPGRESFYEESEHYKVLRRGLLGEGEQVGGFLGRAILAVLRRTQVHNSLKHLLGR